MQRRPWRIPSCTGLTTTRPHSECEWKRGDGQPKRPNSRDSGHHGGLDEVAFSWKLFMLSHAGPWLFPERPAPASFRYTLVNTNRPASEPAGVNIRNR